MPHLSPLNWIFLYILFWGSVLLMSIMIWWSKKFYFMSKSMKSLVLMKNKWSW